MMRQKRTWHEFVQNQFDNTVNIQIPNICFPSTVNNAGFKGIVFFFGSVWFIRSFHRLHKVYIQISYICFPGTVNSSGFKGIVLSNEINP